MLSAKLAKQLKPRADGTFAPERERFAWLKRPFQVVFRELDLLYLATLRWITKRRRNMALIGFAALLVFVGSCSLMPMMGSEFVAPEDRGQFTVSILLPAGTSLERTSALTLTAERALLRDRRIVTVYSTVGGTGDPNQADWRVVTVPKWERDVGLGELQQVARDTVQRNIPEAAVFVSLPGIVEGGRNYPIAYYVQGEDYDELERTAYRFADILRGTPGAADVDVDYQPGKPEVQILVNRDRAAQMGVPVALIARTVRASMEGEVAGKLRDGDDEVDIRVRLREEDRASETLVSRLQVPSPRGFVPVSDLAELGRGEGPAVIERLDRQRTIKVTAAANGRALGDIVAEATQKIEAERLPPGITWQLLGDAKMMQESNESLGVALLLAIVFIYLVLASQFESFLHPITIMMSLPMAVVGAVVALFLQGSSLSLSVFIGIILLMGLVTKNGILLVDHAVVKVREGATPIAAILDAGPARLRPILMTSAAMVLGMLPTAVGQGPGSEFRGPMAMGVIGGVISSTFLTLFVVPVIYLFIEGLRVRASKVVRRRPKTDAAADPSAAE
jgi:multidrug efflux pump subunit AcrB